MAAKQRFVFIGPWTGGSFLAVSLPKGERHRLFFDPIPGTSVDPADRIRVERYPSGVSRVFLDDGSERQIGQHGDAGQRGNLADELTPEQNAYIHSAMAIIAAEEAKKRR
jgi:hypothetical protein